MPPLADLAIDLYLPGDTGMRPSPLTTHNGASQTNYVSETGNHAGEPTLPVGGDDAALVLPGARRGDGAGRHAAPWWRSATRSPTARARPPTPTAAGPTLLARRLAAQAAVRMAVLNAGIGGNRVLGDGAGISALARFDRDVLTQPGVTHVIVLEGINDIGIAPQQPDADAPPISSPGTGS